MKEVREIRVSGKTPVKKLADVIFHTHEEGFDMEVRAIGASSVNQMYKAIAVARGLLAVKGKDLLIRPGFSEITEDDGEKTVLVARLVIR